jgi:hypothetical protein
MPDDASSSPRKIDLFSRYVEARSRPMGQGWDVDMAVPPWQC